MSDSTHPEGPAEAPRRLFPLRGVIQRYDWGSPTAIPELLGVAPDGTPQAELWLGAHPNAPAQVQTGAGPIPLDAFIRRDPEGVLGPAVARRFDGELPYLLKILAADAPLSIQAHPSAAQARAGFDREESLGVARDAPERRYRDPHPKPELICAVSPFRALNRFRPADEIAAGFAALGVAGLEAVCAPLREQPDARGLAAFFRAWMTLDPARRGAQVAEATARAAHADLEPDVREEIARLAAAYPGDPGVLAPLFLNVVELAPGEAMFLPAGELHSYLRGVGIEVMASSDNVLRGGLTSKHVDVSELLDTLTFASGPVERLRPEPAGAAEARYVTPAEHFSLSVHRLARDLSWWASRERGVEILLCVRGRAEARGEGGERVALPRGAALLAPAVAGAYALEGDAEVIRVGVGA